MYPEAIGIGRIDARDRPPEAVGAGDGAAYPCYTDTTKTPAHSYGGMEKPASIAVRTYPDGSRQGVAYIHRGKPGISDEASWWALLSQDERDEANKRRSDLHAQRSMQVYIRSADLTRLTTFTNGAQGDGFTSLREALRMFEAWYTSGGGRNLLGPCVVLPERGGRNGRIHLHAAVARRKRLRWDAIRVSWTNWLNTHGYPSRSTFHRFHAGDDTGKWADGCYSARECALYMAGYLGKSLSSEPRDPYEHRFESFGVTPVEPQRLSGFFLSDVVPLLWDTFAGSVEFEWFHDPAGNRAGLWFDVPAPSGGGG